MSAAMEGGQRAVLGMHKIQQDGGVEDFGWTSDFGKSGMLRGVFSLCDECRVCDV